MNPFCIAKKRHSLSLVAALALAASGCQLERMFGSDEVAAGVARLSVRSAATLVPIVDADATCGFASPQVKADALVEGELGSPGQVTWTVTDCAIDFGALSEKSADCSGVKTLVGGKVVVSATRTVSGIVTGNPDDPVIPTSPDAVKLSFSVTPQNFQVRTSAAKNGLRMISGRFEFEAEPHLAVSQSQQVCAVPTNDLTLSALRYTDAKVEVDDDGRRFDVDVRASRLEAQVGRWVGRENFVGGEITVWDKHVKLPVAGDTDRLDPDYDADAFLASYACREDLQQPVSFECPSMREHLVQGGAQLSIALFGRIADVIDRDAKCGFASDAVTGSADLIGGVGERGGTAVYRVSKCVLSYPTRTEVARDCNGRAYFFEGEVEVTGTKKVYGLITGDPAEPIIPTSRDPAEFDLSLKFTNLKFDDSTSPGAITALTGTLSGRSHPRTALDTSLGVCSIRTPIAKFERVAWKDAELLVHQSGHAFRLSVDSSNLTAHNGEKDGRTNYLSGTISVDGESLSVPVGGGDPVLDPGWDADTFRSSFMCAPNARFPLTDDECGFVRPLAEGAARLLVRATGTLAGVVNDDSTCGFATTTKLLAPDKVEGENGGDPQEGRRGRIRWDIRNCGVGARNDVRRTDLNCLGEATFMGGSAIVDASRWVTGRLYNANPVSWPRIWGVTPDSHEAATIELDSAKLTELGVYTLAPGAAQPTEKLTLHTGQLTVRMQPLLGERKNASGTFDVPTPVARFTQIKLTNSTATLVSGGKTFSLWIPAATINALNGSFAGQSNELTGAITIGTTEVNMERIPLNPDFNQATFNASYSCNADLRAPIPPN